MNHLAHLYLAEGHPGWLCGALLGDVVKGRLAEDDLSGMTEGVRLHRAIDAFADSHPVAARSRQRFRKEYRRYGAIMTDIIYDHFLAQSWSDWDHRSLATFSEEVLGTIINEREHLPARVVQTSERLRERRALVHYAGEVFVDRSLQYLGSRLSRANPLDSAFDEFTRCRDELKQDFHDFFPELVKFTNDWKHDRQP